MHWNHEGHTHFSCPLYQSFGIAHSMNLHAETQRSASYQTSYRKPCLVKDSGVTYLEFWKKEKKKKSNDLEFCIQHNYPSKVKEKYRSSQRSKSRPALQETVWKVPQREGGEGSETQISVKKRRVREEIVKSLRSFLETLTVNGADCYLNPILLENSDN